MGTRHLIIVYYKGEYRVAQYGQWDGYPDGQGVDLLAIIRDPANIAKLQAALDNNLVYVPNEEQVEEINQAISKAEDERRERRLQSMRAGGGINMDDVFIEAKRSPMNTLYPTLSRDTGAQIVKHIADATQPVPIQLGLSFISDTLFCEWAYVVDLDARVLEVYCGKTRSQKGGRFEDFRGPGTVGKFAFDHLPEDADFVAQCKRE